MTLRASLARYVKGLLEEPTPTPSLPPTPSPESNHRIPTRSTTTPSPATSEAGVLPLVLETMREMQSEQLREMREMVLSILQGRPLSDEQLAQMATQEPESQPSRTPFDPPDYDSAGTDGLSPGIAAILDREDEERGELLHLQTEQSVLAWQREQARAALTDPQGPDSTL